MAIPLVSDVLTGAAALLGDLAAEQFTSTVLLPWYSMAYREAYSLAMTWRLPVATRDAYYFLPANSVALTPAQMSITDMGEPIDVWARPNVSTLTITGVTNATPMVVTTSVAHGLGEGAPVEIYGVASPVLIINQQWRIHPTGASSFSLIGSTAGGVWVSGGTVISGGEESVNPFVPVTLCMNLPQLPVAPSLLYWRWMNDMLRFTGASGDVELWVEYLSSGAPPQSGSIGWDNCQNFLQSRTAGLIASAYDMPGTGALQTLVALGQSGQPDGTGGALRGFMYPMLMQKMRNPKRSMPFRRRTVAYGRNAGYGAF